MKYKILAAALLFLGSSQASSKTLYVECKYIEIPSHAIALEKLTEKQQSNFVREALEKGVLRSIVAPSLSWVINVETGYVFAPDDESNESIEKANINSGVVNGRLKNGNSFALNRINGILRISSTHTKYGVTLIGIPIEMASTWILKCLNISKPAI